MLVMGIFLHPTGNKLLTLFLRHCCHCCKSSALILFLIGFYCSRFCTECKSKVLRAYSILAGDLDGPSEKG